MFTERTLEVFMSKKTVEKIKPRTWLAGEEGLASQTEIVEMEVPDEKKEPSIHDELVEINAMLKEMLELLKDIEYNTHDRTRFLEWKEINYG